MSEERIVTAKYLDRDQTEEHLFNILAPLVRDLVETRASRLMGESILFKLIKGFAFGLGFYLALKVCGGL